MEVAKIEIDRSKEVRLSWSEMLGAALVGVMRQIENLKKRNVDSYGASETEGWQINVEGAMGECALAKYLGVYWKGKGDTRAPDVGGVDVRTRSRHNYDLIIHPSDEDSRSVYLLTGLNGRYVVRGWIRAEDGKRPEFWKDPTQKNRWAYFVPQASLNPATQPIEVR